MLQTHLAGAQRRQINMTKGLRDEGLGSGRGLSAGQFEGADPAVQLGFSLSVGRSFSLSLSPSLKKRKKKNLFQL